MCSWKSWKSKTWVTNSNPRGTSSNPQVTISNLWALSSNPQIRRLKARVPRLKALVWTLKAQVGRLKARVRRLKARVEAIKPRVRQKTYELKEKILSSNYWISRATKSFHCLAIAELKPDTKVFKIVFHNMTLKKHIWQLYCNHILAAGKLRSTDSI